MTDQPTHEPTTITVPRPHVTHGPKGVAPVVADADYLRAAVRNIEHQSHGERLWGSGVTAMVTQLLNDASDALSAAAEAPPTDHDEAARLGKIALETRDWIPYNTGGPHDVTDEQVHARVGQAILDAQPSRPAIIDPDEVRTVTSSDGERTWTAQSLVAETQAAIRHSGEGSVNGEIMTDLLMLLAEKDATIARLATGSAEPDPFVVGPSIKPGEPARAWRSGDIILIATNSGSATSWAKAFRDELLDALDREGITHTTEIGRVIRAIGRARLAALEDGQSLHA